MKKKFFKKIILTAFCLFFTNTARPAIAQLEQNLVGLKTSMQRLQHGLKNLSGDHGLGGLQKKLKNSIKIIPEPTPSESDSNAWTKDDQKALSQFLQSPDDSIDSQDLICKLTDVKNRKILINLSVENLTKLSQSKILTDMKASTDTQSRYPLKTGTEIKNILAAEIFWATVIRPEDKTDEGKKILQEAISAYKKVKALGTNKQKEIEKFLEALSKNGFNAQEQIDLIEQFQEQASPSTGLTESGLDKHLEAQTFWNNFISRKNNRITQADLTNHLKYLNQEIPKEILETITPAHSKDTTINQIQEYYTKTIQPKIEASTAAKDTQKKVDTNDHITKEYLFEERLLTYWQNTIKDLINYRKKDLNLKERIEKIDELLKQVSTLLQDLNDDLARITSSIGSKINNPEFIALKKETNEQQKKDLEPKKEELKKSLAGKPKDIDPFDVDAFITKHTTELLAPLFPKEKPTPLLMISKTRDIYDDAGFPDKTFPANKIQKRIERIWDALLKIDKITPLKFQGSLK